MTDEELIGYCESHCTTERALFHSKHINRMIILAGRGEHDAKLDGWYSMHSDMQNLVDMARGATK
jgi:hypothetical protein